MDPHETPPIDPSGATESQTDPGHESAPERRHFDSFSEAMRAAKEDACSKARETVPKVKSAVADAVHEMAYGGAYGAVFVGAFAAELVPKAIREGLAKGAKAGRAKAREARDKVREAMTPKEQDASTEEVVIEIDTEPSGA